MYGAKIEKMIDTKPTKFVGYSVSINPECTLSITSLQPRLAEHNHKPIRVVTYYNDEAIINVWCKDCKQELEKKVFKWKE